MKIFQKENINELYALLESRTRAGGSDIRGRVEEIISRVERGGDAAVRELSLEIDGYAPETLELDSARLRALADEVPVALRDSLKRAAENIFAYHERQKSYGYEIKDGGSVLGRIVRPLARVGVYVPGGTAALPSTLLMNCIPAKVAGVKEIIIATPPKKEGISPVIAAAADAVGVNRVFTVGGAQAVAAMAFGTESIPRVDKIAGPGNIYVAEAKKQLFGRVAIDMIAGPSEVLIIASPSARADFIAADMLSQLEHDARACALLITESAALADKVGEELEKQAAALTRSAILGRSMQDYCAAYICGGADEAFEVANNIAPEHLELLTDDPAADLARVRNAGSVFLGSYSPEPLGDYFAGTNHVLPTNGTARFSSPLSVDDFVKKMSYLGYDRNTLLDAADDIIRLAECEGLDAHAASVRIRRENEA